MQLSYLIVVVVIMLALWVLLYIRQREETFSSSEFTYNKDSADIRKTIENVPLEDGKFLSVYQCRPMHMDNGSVFSPLGQYLKITDGPAKELDEDEIKLPCLSLLTIVGKEPEDYSPVWSSRYMKKPPSQDFSIWRPIAPDGFKALCDICVLGFSKPSNIGIVCLPYDMVEASPVLKNLLLDVEYRTGGIDASFQCWEVSSHHFFRCGNFTSADNKKRANSSIDVELLENPKNLINYSVNVKQDVL